MSDNLLNLNKSQISLQVFRAHITSIWPTQSYLTSPSRRHPLPTSSLPAVLLVPATISRCYRYSEHRTSYLCLRRDFYASFCGEDWSRLVLNGIWLFHLTCSVPMVGLMIWGQKWRVGWLPLISIGLCGCKRMSYKWTFISIGNQEQDKYMKLSSQILSKQAYDKSLREVVWEYRWLYLRRDCTITPTRKPLI